MEDQYLYLLVNHKTGEAYLPPQGGNCRVRIGGIAERIRSISLRKGRWPEGQLIPESWLKDAELMVFKMEWLGTVTRHVEKDPFVF